MPCRLHGFPMILVSLTTALHLSVGALASCPQKPRRQAELHWSRHDRVVSPDSRWLIEVQPDYSDNKSSVRLRDCQQDRSWTLFTLERDAVLHWSPDSKSLLIVNSPGAGDDEVRVFPVDALSEGRQMSASDTTADSVVHRAVVRQLGRNRQVQFYLARFVVWKRNRVVLAIGGQTTNGDTGPLRTYCYGFEIDVVSQQVLRSLSRDQLRRRYGTSCVVSP